jgi:hypothetical protein
MYCWHCGAETVSAGGVCPNCGQAPRATASEPEKYNPHARFQAPPPSSFQYTATPPRQREKPNRSAGNSALQLGCMVLLGIGILKIVASLPAFIHGVKENVAQDIVLSNSTHSIMYAEAGYTTYTWSVQVRNTGSKSHQITLECSFCDSSGTALDIDRVEDIVIQPGETQTIHDNQAILTVTAVRVSSTRVRAY